MSFPKKPFPDAPSIGINYVSLKLSPLEACIAASASQPFRQIH